MKSPEHPWDAQDFFCRKAEYDMLAQTKHSLTEVLSRNKVIPVVENRTQFLSALTMSAHKVIFLRNCDLFDLKPLCQQAAQQSYLLYVNVDRMSGIHPDAAGLDYLVEQLHITGITSTNLKTLTLGKSLGLHTMLHIFAADSTGLESAVEMVNVAAVDLFNVSPALVVPCIAETLTTLLSRPFIASGLISTRRQIQAVVQTGALGVVVPQPELW
jgi:glycerol uptake operon antiterminator